ncbi:hypothetical protein N7450_001006 [Penicillium hetheringtonii]|uniref:Uncharacterized protein n=1 Tax=Penicillium hetheringtonii TaxID=911720 RepID=A0AAD6H109_9EURO|nr:hypothetical protein N7450_001006 [Penicillium hetheringtonii]
MANRSTDTSGAGLAHGSSTGAPGIPTGVQDQRAQYDPNTTGVNPSTGAAYSKTRAGSYSKPDRGPSPSNSYDTGAGDARMQHPPSTSERVRMEQQQEKAVGDQSKGGQAGQDLGQSLRGALTSAVDRAFGSDESAEWNEEIARRGEQEIRSGKFGNK